MGTTNQAPLGWGAAGGLRDGAPAETLTLYEMPDEEGGEDEDR